MTGVHQVSGLHFDLQSGDLWLVDRGESLWDEIYRFPEGSGAGLDLGWPGWEGMDSLRSGTAAALVHFPDAVLPAQDLSGGIVYRGEQIPMLYQDYLAFSEESGMVYGFQDSGSGAVLMHMASTHRPGLRDLSADHRAELVATDGRENKFLFLLERCSGTTPPGKLYADAYPDGRVNYRFEQLPDAAIYEVTVRNLDGNLIHRNFVVTNLQRMTDVPLGRTYVWRVRAQCNNGIITAYSSPDTIVMPVGIAPMVRVENEVLSGNVKVSYPDANRVLISVSGPLTPQQLLIYDLQGRLVFVQDPVQGWPVEVNHGTWPAGLYVIQLNTASDRLTSRMVVQH